MTIARFGHRRDALWLAALVHRLSGLALAIFLPLHFLALGLALGGAARLGAFIEWTRQPPVELAEAGLVFLLVVHLAGGLRLLWLENFAWRDGQKWVAALAVAAAAVAALAFVAIVLP